MHGGGSIMLWGCLAEVVLIHCAKLIKMMKGDNLQILQLSLKTTVKHLKLGYYFIVSMGTMIPNINTAFGIDKAD